MRKLALVLLLAGCAARTEVSPLVAAVRNGNVAETKTLIARGADVNAPSGVNRWTPLLHAVHKNQLDTAAALLAAGADPNRAAPDGTTPLMMAAGYAHREMITLLLHNDADAKAVDRRGDAAIDYALTGVTDLDDFTYFKCQDYTVLMLKDVSPQPRPSSAQWAKWKGCDGGA